jgi:hypothetical protein
MPTVGKVSRHVEIRRLRTRVTGIRVLPRNMEAFHKAIITGSADLGLTRASTPREDDGADCIEMSTKPISEFKVSIVYLLRYGIEGEFLLRASSTRQGTFSAMGIWSTIGRFRYVFGSREDVSIRSLRERLEGL